ncbi:MAG TPA: MEDS domain-containing protein [Gemmatimonadales bacterium]|nr:MEDS domain-containing protein [Gemmatimonadales bacterium]
MSYGARLLDNPEPTQHIVQLYGTDEQLLIRSLARYLAEGLHRGDSLLVIATPEHKESVFLQLRQDRAYPKAVLEGRLVFLDAHSTLSQVLLDGHPDWQRFESVLGAAVRDAQERAGHGGVRTYGEMVGLLWSEGRFSAAALLEKYWNSLLARSNLSLFCAYPIDIFGDEFRMEAVDQLMCAHTHMLPVDDALESALNRAMDEVLGPRMDGLRGLMKANYRPTWAVVPRSEAIILWLRNNLPGSADAILELARRYYQPLATSDA